jgi:hypothetical protein
MYLEDMNHLSWSREIFEGLFPRITDSQRLGTCRMQNCYVASIQQHPTLDNIILITKMQPGLGEGLASRSIGEYHK